MAHAQPEILSDGVFITHYPPGSVYTNSDQCEWYAQYAITDCAAQNPRFDAAHGVWYVLAAWYSDKSFCGLEFGFGTYPVDAAGFLASGGCPSSALPIPSSEDWPGPNTGVSLAATSESWNGNLLPVYWFDMYSYYATVIPLGVNPATSFGGFANCLTPPVSYGAVAFGAMGVLMDGQAVCPPPPGQVVCCVGEACVLVFTSDECAGMGGVFHPEWSSCDGDPCAPPPPVAVCCVVHQCYLVLEDECTVMQGAWHPEWTTCDGDPCDIYTPVEPSSWGAIKAIYR
jgi:hypothetical protein